MENKLKEIDCILKVNPDLEYDSTCAIMSGIVHVDNFVNEVYIKRDYKVKINFNYLPPHVFSTDNSIKIILIYIVIVIDCVCLLIYHN